MFTIFMLTPKMAAPMKTCLTKLRKCCLSLSFSRNYARRMKRSVQDLMLPEQDVQKIKHPIADPRKNAYLPFDPSDPVQKSLSSAAARTKDKYFTDNTKIQVNVKDKVKNVNKDGRVHPPENVEKILSPPRENSSKLRSKDEKDQKNAFTFERLVETDRRFGRLIMGARSKKDRDELREIVLEGKNLIIDALTAGAKLKVLYFTRSGLMEDFPVEFLMNAQIYQVQYRHLKLWSDVEAPQGLLGIFEMPPADRALRPAANPIPVTLICDSVRDGGNLGTLIRTAAAVGCHRVIALKGCVDVWNGKVLRSAAGSHYRVPIVSNVTWPQVPALLPPADSIKVFLADSNQVTEQYRQSLLGTLEGVTQIEQLQDTKLDRNELDSDNEIVGNSELIDSDIDESDVENEIISKQEKQEMIKDEDSSYKSFEVLNRYRQAPLGVEFYDNVDYTDKHTVLLISGETAGVSLPARKLAYDHYGACVTIPMEAEVESLNCAVAGSIIMYEIAKQYRRREACSS